MLIIFLAGAMTLAMMIATIISIRNESKSLTAVEMNQN